jgi:seryl-tRNA synthetase
VIDQKEEESKIVREQSAQLLQEKDANTQQYSNDVQSIKEECDKVNKENCVLLEQINDFKMKFVSIEEKMVQLQSEKTEILTLN